MSHQSHLSSGTPRSPHTTTPVRSVEGYIIVLANLPPQTTQFDIDDLLDTHCTDINVRQVTVGVDKQHNTCSGYAMLTCNTLAEADSVISKLNAVQLYGKTVAADYAFAVNNSSSSSSIVDHSSQN